LTLPANRLADLDLNIGDFVFKKKITAFSGHDEAVIATERCRRDADPEDDGLWVLFSEPNADNFNASEIDLH
jgi:hypothetical protein